MPVAVGVWLEQDQEVYERSLRPRAAPQVIARWVAQSTPRGCCAVLDYRDHLGACPAPVVPGRAFCARHADLGWCDRACAWPALWGPPLPSERTQSARLQPRPRPPPPPPAEAARVRVPAAPRTAPPPPPAASPWADFPPIPPRSWTRAVPWGDERYAADACAEDWARLARVVCTRNEVTAVSLGESHARIKPRVGDWRGEHVVAHRARAVLGPDDPLAHGTARV